MIALTFIKFAFLLLLPFQSRGRGRENTSPLPSFRLRSKSSDRDSGCPRQKASRIYLIQNKPRFCLLQKLLLRYVSEEISRKKERNYKAIVHHVIQLTLILLVRKRCKR